MATVLKLDDVVVDTDAEDIIHKSCRIYQRGTYPTYSFEQRSGVLTYPAPHLGKTCELEVDGSVIFQGRVTAAVPAFTPLGWVWSYQAMGQRYIGDLYPFIHEPDLMDSATFNLSADDPSYDATRAGRTVGQILSTVLQWDTNAANLVNAGIVYDTTLTQGDLDALDHVPPKPVSVQGDKLLSAVESFLSSQAPNHCLFIDPATGILRFINLRACTPITLTAGAYNGSPPQFSIDTSDCKQAVLIKGQPWADAALVSLANGGLAEDFGYNAPDGTPVSNSAAKAAWDISQFQDPSNPNSAALSEGTCTVGSTTTITINPSDDTQYWSADYWDQSTGRKGVIYLYSSVLTGVTQYVCRRVVDHGALTAGGTCTLTVDLPLPDNTYSQFKLYGTAGGPLNVWRKYRITNEEVAEHLADRFSFPVPFVSSVSTQVAMHSFPVATIVNNGQEAPVTFQIDKSTGHVYFDLPTYMLYNDTPDDVRVLLAVYTGVNECRIPASGYEGTSNADYGLEDTLVVFLRDWRDPLNKAQVEDWGQDLLDSLKDTQVSGSLEVWSKLSDAFTMGRSINLEGDGWTTGYETASIPIVGCELEWCQGDAVLFKTHLQLSNRCNPYGADDYMQPQRAFATLGGGENVNPYVKQEGFKTYTAEDTLKYINDQENKQRNQGSDSKDADQEKMRKRWEDELETMGAF